MTAKKPVETEFDRFAGEYEDLLKDPVREYFAPRSDFFVSRKLDILGECATRLGRNTRTATWLDVGCGKGQLLRAGRSQFARAVGCDRSVDMLKACADLDVVQQVEDDRLPFADASADWVTAVCVYHHVDGPSRARLTTEIHRVLKPGGVFAIIEHNPLNPAVQVIVRRTVVDASARLLTAGKARRELRRGDFRIAGTRYFLVVPQGLYRACGWIERACEALPVGGQYCVLGVKNDDPSASSR